MAMIEPNDEEKQEKLPQDYSPPFSPPSGVKDNTDDTHPEADTNVDDHERYDEGISGAIEVDDPGVSIVEDYNPPKNDDDDDEDDEDDDKDDAEEE